MALVTTVSFSSGFRLSKAADFVTGGLVANPQVNTGSLLNLITGVGVGAADLVYAKHHSVVAGSPVALDVAGTTLLDPNGDAIAMVKLKMAIFSTLVGATPSFTVANTAGNIEIMGGSNPVLAFVKDPSDILVLRPNSFQFFFDAAGWPITAATGDLIKLLSSAGTNAVDVVLVGTSA